MSEQRGAPRFRNRLLACLSETDQQRFSKAAERVALSRDDVLERPNEPIESVYFLESAVGSIVATDGSRRRVEAGPFGREGASGVAVVLGSDRSPHETNIQVPGEAFRIRSADFHDLLDESPTLRSLMLRYALALSIQTTHTVLAASHGVLEIRLARWILMIHDRVDGDELWLTHDFMAMMLGVRRPGVTTTIHELEGHALIRSKRGYLLVRDRTGLEKLCGGLYGGPEAAYARLFGSSA